MAARLLRFLFTTGLVFGLAACVASPVSVTGNATALKAAQSSMAIGVGQEKDLLPFIRIASTGAVPFIPLTWEVSNPALLSIDPATGRAKGLSKGAVVVQVKAQGNDAGATQLMIEVMGEGAAVVKDVRVIPASHQMVLGESVTLRAEVQMPDGQVNGNVIWASSDDTIATVNRTNGAVVALKTGRVTILAAYAPSPEFKGIADIYIYSNRAEVPSSPTPAPESTRGDLASMAPNAARSSLPKSSHTSTEQAASSAPVTKISPLPLPSVASLPSPPPYLAPMESPEPSVPLPSSPRATPTGTPTMGPRFLVTTLAGSSYGFLDAAGSSAKFGYISDVAVNPSGVLYAADPHNDSIRRVQPDGAVSTSHGISNQYDRAIGGIAFNSEGDLFVAGLLDHKIYKFTTTGQRLTFAGNGNQGYADGDAARAEFNYPASVAVDDAGNVYVADFYNHRIRKIAPNGTVSTLAGSGVAGRLDGVGVQARFHQPIELAVDRASNVYVVDSDNHCIRKVTPEGVVTTFAGNGWGGFIDGNGTQAKFLSPSGVSVDVDGGVVIADTGNRAIRKISQNGEVSTIIRSVDAGLSDGPLAEAQFSEIYNVTVDRAGNIYVADKTRIRLIRRQ